MSDLQYVQLHGNRVAYRDTGSGEVLVLIHGMAGCSDTWEAILPRLAQRYRVIAPDLLGHGQSAKPRTDYSLGAFAAGLRDLLDELEVSRATIVGHSLGGGVAMQFLYQHPEYCRRLILVSSGGLGPDVGWMLRLLAAPGAEFVLPVMAPKVVRSIGNRARSWLGGAGLGSLRSLRAEQYWRAYCSLSDASTRAAFLRTLRSVVDYRGQSVSALSRLSLWSAVPTLVIWGERDQIIPVAHGSAVRVARPDSRLEVLPGLGHFPHVESPAKVVTLIEEFMAGSHDAADVGLRRLIDRLKSRKEVDMAIGVLMSVRGCPQNEAVNEFISAVHETGVDPDDLARALVGLVAGTDDSPHRAEAKRRWGALLTLRELDNHDDFALAEDAIGFRTAPENESPIS